MISIPYSYEKINMPKLNLIGNNGIIDLSEKGDTYFYE